MGSSMTHESSLFPLSNPLKSIHHAHNRMCLNTRTRLREVKAAISEDLAKLLKPEKAVTFKVRAVLTVRNKHQEDFKETLVKKVDAFADQIGRNVVLELYSIDIHPKTRAPKKSKAAVLKDWSQNSNIHPSMLMEEVKNLKLKLALKNFFSFKHLLIGILSFLIVVYLISIF